MTKSREDPAAPTVRVERAEAAPAGGWSLLVVTADAVRSHRLPASGSVVLGRAEDSDVRIPDGSVSRSHARIDIGPVNRVVDLESANGVYVRRRRLASGESAEFSPGDVLELGTVTVVVQRGAPTAGRDGWVAAGAGPAVLVPAGPPARRDPGVVAEDTAMTRVLELVERVAPGGITVLLLGETGTGKEVVASVLHAASGRPGPFLRLNCAAISPTLLESELFGHEKGAFTGAVAAKPGLLESAEGGTVLLDEIGEMPVELQSRLLRVIEEREVLRVGGREPRRIDVRFVAATNRDLLAACEAGAFRRDLYYRLNGVSVSIPPLRERPADVEPLARRFLEPSGATLSPEALAVVTAYTWPGNARELRNALERAALLCGPARVIEPEHLPAEVRVPASGATSADAPPTGTERERIEEALRRCAGNQTHAARMLGISRRTLVNRLRELGIPRPRSPRR